MAQDKKIRCVSCGKPIAEEISIQAGYVKITCKCGTVNEIKAAPDPTKLRPISDRNGKWHIPSRVNIDLAPYGERVEMVTKDLTQFEQQVKKECDEIRRQGKEPVVVTYNPPNGEFKYAVVGK